MKLFSPIGSLFIALVVATCATNVRADLYVSPQGNDGNNGRSVSKAFATIQRARDEIRNERRKKNPNAESVVQILGGSYEIRDSIELAAEDSGTVDRPIIYRAYRDQPVILSGGRRVRISDFKPVADPDLLARLDPAARDKIVALRLGEFALSHGGPFPQVFNDGGGIFEVFSDGRRLPMASWPKKGEWATVKKVLVNGDKTTAGVFEYRDDRPERWINNPNLWLKGQWRVGWEDPAIRVARIDPSTKTIEFAAGLSLGIGNKYTRPAGNGKEPWRAINIPEELTEPGEWAIDFQSQTLLLYPKPDSTEIVISQLDKPFVVANGASNVRFIGITFEYSLGDGLSFRDVDSVLVAGCTLNLAGNGITLHGYRSGVQSCDMYAIGAGCILVSGGDKLTLARSDNFIVNNHLHNYGVLKAMYSPAVSANFGAQAGGKAGDSCVGLRVANNLIHDAPRDAVLVSGQNNLFELNEIYRCGFGSADVGAFYSVLDWTIRGITIRHNYIHNTVGGVNPDDGATGNLVEGNIFAGPRTGVWIASGQDHAVRHNIFVKNQGEVFGVDDRGVGRKYATNARLLGGVKSINPQSPPWSETFPQMVALDRQPELPRDVSFASNVVVIQTGEPVRLSGKSGLQEMVSIKDNFVTATDPGFVNIAEGNLSLKPDAEVFQKIPGFPPIPFDKIGLVVDEYRRTLPSPGELNRPRNNPMTHSSDERNFGT